MSGIWLLARRNLTGNRVRLVVSAGGVALALSLTLALDAIYAGVANQMTTYIDRAGADVWVAQAGVRNLHMVASWMPDSLTDEIRAVPGVAHATPILEATDIIAAGGESGVAYVIGLPADAKIGGPWNVSSGIGLPGRGEVVVDARFAANAGIGLGDSVTVLGGQARVVGLSEGTASLVNSVAFVSFDDFQAKRGGSPVVSYVLVQVAPGATDAAIAAEIERRIPGVTAQSAATFAVEERRLVMDMSGDVISIMNGIGFVVGLTVMALTVYIATLSRRREYGVLKALGAGGRFLYGVVLSQAFLSVLLGYVVAVAFTGLLALVIPRIGLNLELAISGASVAKVAVAAGVIAALAAIFPIRQIANLDPALVFRRGVTA
jgi:putative ABC transport system permease protein